MPTPDKGLIAEKRKMATSIAEFSSYSRSRDRLKAVLDTLWVQPEHKVTDKSGRATQVLYNLMPAESMKGVRGEERMGMASFISVLREISTAGFITRETNGKRTYVISVAHRRPTDWVPPTEIEPPTEAEVREVTPSTTNGKRIHPSDVMPGDDVEATVIEAAESVADYDTEAREGGIRPGRLAARLEAIERTIPALVEEGVVAGINGWFGQIAVALGYNQQTIDTGEVADLIEQVDNQERRIESLTDELRAERRSNITAREELNRILRSTISTRETSPVRPSDLQEAYRGLATHAISNGWTLHRTGGGHIMWKAPSGERYFTASTSSDWRAVRNARSDMEKMGLPKE